jgi:hypothetical protein
VLLPIDSHTPITSITAVLLPFVTCLLTLPRMTSAFGNTVVECRRFSRVSAAHVCRRGVGGEAAIGRNRDERRVRKTDFRDGNCIVLGWLLYDINLNHFLQVQVLGVVPSEDADCGVNHLGEGRM